MNPPVDARYLELFPSWLSSLGDDARALGALVSANGASDDASRRYATAGLNYIFKSLDLIPDGIDDLGFLDDAFVLRVASALALAEHSDDHPQLARLAEDAKAIKEFLGDDYARLETYVKNLRKGAARGRTVDEILGDDATRTVFTHEVSAWCDAYKVPSFTRDVKTLIKLKAFLNAKLA
jgi:uncharacterized membrane protein YkvA (DUF1232 family)